MVVVDKRSRTNRTQFHGGGEKVRKVSGMEKTFVCLFQSAANGIFNFDRKAPQEFGPQPHTPSWLDDTILFYTTGQARLYARKERVKLD